MASLVKCPGSLSAGRQNLHGTNNSSCGADGAELRGSRSAVLVASRFPPCRRVVRVGTENGLLCRGQVVCQLRIRFGLLVGVPTSCIVPRERFCAAWNEHFTHPLVWVRVFAGLGARLALHLLGFRVSCP